jgi:hypothetical protein
VVAGWRLTSLSSLLLHPIAPKILSAIRHPLDPSTRPGSLRFRFRVCAST